MQQAIGVSLQRVRGAGTQRVLPIVESKADHPKPYTGAGGRAYLEAQRKDRLDRLRRLLADILLRPAFGRVCPSRTNIKKEMAC